VISVRGHPGRGRARPASLTRGQAHAAAAAAGAADEGDAETAKGSLKTAGPSARVKRESLPTSTTARDAWPRPASRAATHGRATAGQIAARVISAASQLSATHGI